MCSTEIILQVHERREIVLLSKSLNWQAKIDFKQRAGLHRGQTQKCDIGDKVERKKLKEC